MIMTISVGGREAILELRTAPGAGRVEVFMRDHRGRAIANTLVDLDRLALAVEAMEIMEKEKLEINGSRAR
jgi:hypothetical protein